MHSAVCAGIDCCCKYTCITEHHSLTTDRADGCDALASSPPRAEVTPTSVQLDAPKSSTHAQLIGRSPLKPPWISM